MNALGENVGNFSDFFGPEHAVVATRDLMEFDRVVDAFAPAKVGIDIHFGVGGLDRKSVV